MVLLRHWPARWQHDKWVRGVIYFKNKLKIWGLFVSQIKLQNIFDPIKVKFLSKFKHCTSSLEGGKLRTFKESFPSFSDLSQSGGGMRCFSSPFPCLSLSQSFSYVLANDRSTFMVNAGDGASTGCPSTQMEVISPTYRSRPTTWSDHRPYDDNHEEDHSVESRAETIVHHSVVSSQQCYFVLSSL